VEKVKHAIMNSLKTCPQFVSSVPQIVGLRPSKFMPEILESLQTHEAFNASFLRKPIQPFDKRGVFCPQLPGRR
jgi:hypothetical protein